MCFLLKTRLFESILLLQKNPFVKQIKVVEGDLVLFLDSRYPCGHHLEKRLYWTCLVNSLRVNEFLALVVEMYFDLMNVPILR